jgi:hypothetical protein
VTTLQGKTYHVVTPGDIDGPLSRWLIDDHHDTLSSQSVVVRGDVLHATGAIRQHLRDNNPYVRALRHLRPRHQGLPPPQDATVADRPLDDEFDDELALPESYAAVVLRDPPSNASAEHSEMAVLLREPELTARTAQQGKRYGAVVMFATAAAARAAGVTRDPSNQGRSFVSTQSALYSRLQYPLLFHTGTGGWYLRYRGDAAAPADADGDSSDASAADASVSATEPARAGADAADASSEDGDAHRALDMSDDDGASPPEPTRTGRQSAASARRWERPLAMPSQHSMLGVPFTRAAYVKHLLYQVA